MTEADARDWIAERWSAAAVELLDRYAEMLRVENAEQNLIARSTVDALWSRHLLDSAQLVPLAATASDGAWIDIGSGAGLPGIVAAILQPMPVVLIEPRRRRAAFLERVVATLDLDAQVVMSRADQYRAAPAAVISARAVASLDELFTQSVHFAGRDTIWLLPKGRSANAEMEIARSRWHAVFHVEQSLTASDSHIVIARKVKCR